MLKRLFDITLALIGFVLLLPLWLVIPIAIYVEDGRPVFFFDARMGKDKKQYRHIKFRSMKKKIEIHSSGAARVKYNGNVTKTGRILRATAMDELPQLVNILKGDMSFVGPRPLMPVETDKGASAPKAVWEFKGFKERSSVKPGLTGLAQIIAERDIPREKKFRYDVWYVKNRSLRLDIKLIALSFLVTLSGRWERRNENSNSRRWANRLLRGKIT